MQQWQRTHRIFAFDFRREHRRCHLVILVVFIIVFVCSVFLLRRCLLRLVCLLQFGDFRVKLLLKLRPRITDWRSVQHLLLRQLVQFLLASYTAAVYFQSGLQSLVGHNRVGIVRIHLHKHLLCCIIFCVVIVVVVIIFELFRIVISLVSCVECVQSTIVVAISIIFLYRVGLQNDIGRQGVIVLQTLILRFPSFLELFVATRSVQFSL
mmetsp:Transcript_16399/g.25268  ORF Transcript_16399/g.25268 Transcript_16399/m.25268 type:complete len:209 (-) Transcript_16399:2666-3292(-)